MKIARFDVITIEIPLVMPVSHHLATRTAATNVLVRCIDETGQSGWGECCPREYVTGESVESACAVLRNVLLPPLVGREFHGDELSGHIHAMLNDLPRKQHAAFCACELALIDLHGRIAGTSAGEFIGPVVCDPVSYSGVIASETPETVRAQAAFIRNAGVSVIKVKVGSSLEANHEILSIVREELGAEASVRIDANCAWSADEALQQLEALRPFNLKGVEQPVAGDDIAGMQKVTAAGITPVVADESLCTYDDACMLIEKKACNIFNLRLSKCGGLSNALRIYLQARAAGLDCQLGAQVGETGFLSAAGRQLAGRCPDLLWCEGSYGRLLLEHDIVDPDITIGPGGLAPALTGPGLGVEPIEDVIKHCTVASFSVA